MQENVEKAAISPALERTEKYKMMLLDWWQEIRELSIDVRSFFFEICPHLEENPQSINITGEDQESIATLISTCLTLWEELEPKMVGKSGETAKKFMECKKYLDNPLALYHNNEEVFRMIRTLRDSLELLDITNLPVTA